MKKISNVIICGLGAIGGYYASKIMERSISLKILVDKDRYQKYKTEPRIINEKKYDFDYLLPEDKECEADLIIISTKSSGLDEAIKNIKNFVGSNTIILSFLNGISSEKKIEEVYGNKVLYSYLVGHTFFRKDDVIKHDGQAKIVFGSNKKNDERVILVKQFFEECGVLYEESNDILKAQWEKFCFNCCVNQISALTRMTFGEMMQSPKIFKLIKNICDEILQIAKKEIGYDGDFYKSTLDYLGLMIPEGKTSMLQDIEAKKIPETDLFGKAVVFLGEKHGISTPYNKIISEVIESILINKSS